MVATSKHSSRRTHWSVCTCCCPRPLVGRLWPESPAPPQPYLLGLAAWSPFSLVTMTL